MKKIIILITLLFVSLSIQAKTFNPSLRLLKVEQVKLSELEGEELYLHVTEYYSGGESESKTIPEHPSFWPSDHLANVTEVPVWDHKLKEGESVSLIISLMEKDFHPWNLDDLIGTVKLRIRNANGELETNWSIPNSPDTGESINTKFGPGKKFTLVGDGSRYILTFALSK